MTSAPQEWIDSHAHMDFYSPEERAGVAAALQQAKTGVISIGTEAKNWGVIAEIAKTRPDIVVGWTVGLHPGHVMENWREEMETMEKILAEEKPIGIGECGLDYFRLGETPNATDVVAWQKAAFDAQLSIMKQNELPVVIHSRGAGAYADIVAMIDKSGLDWRRFVFHCFSEGAKEVKELNARGGRASFTGIITFKNGQQMREALLAQGIERLMVETDAPFLAPEPHRGKQNTPAWVNLVGHKAAELLGISLEALKTRVMQNTREFFKL